MNPAITAFLDCQRIAVVGVSRTRGFGNSIMRTLAERGYEVVPVNANADEIEGKPAYRALTRIPEPVDAVVAVVPPQQTPSVVEDCVRLGIRHLWIQQGAESREAIDRAEKAGLSVIHHRCVLMYAEPRGIHRFHSWVHGLFVRD